MTITEDLGKEERKQICMLLGHFKNNFYYPWGTHPPG